MSSAIANNSSGTTARTTCSPSSAACKPIVARSAIHVSRCWPATASDERAARYEAGLSDDLFARLRRCRALFHARDMLGQAHPGLRQGQPQRLVALGVGQPRHRHTLFRTLAVIL